MNLRSFISTVFSRWATEVGAASGLPEDFTQLRLQGPRLLLHDAVHMLAGAGFHLKGEEAAAIVQSTLTRDLNISLSPVRVHSPAHRDRPVLSDFMPDFFEKIRMHTNNTWRRFHPGEDVLPQTQTEPLSDAGRKKYYELAVAFDRKFEEHYKKPFYQCGVDELSALHVQELSP